MIDGSMGEGAEAGTLREGKEARLLADVRRGMAKPQKELSSKYFYDTRGSELFEDITRLPEYYLTGTERALLADQVAPWVAQSRPATLVELGAGSARKTRVLLDAMRPGAARTCYVPVDVASDFIHATARELRDEYEELDVRPVVQDISHPLEFVEGLERPVLFALLGSTIGNFDGDAAIAMLSNIRQAMDDGDCFLMGADLRPGPGKSLERLEAAYNDAAGVTAAFNLNILRVINDRLGTDFDPAAFEHRAGYNAEAGRIEMHLVSTGDQVVQIPGGDAVEIRQGETIRTEISCKYDRATVEALFASAGLSLRKWFQDPGDLYTLVMGGPRP